jgi:lipoprotein NlpI
MTLIWCFAFSCLSQTPQELVDAARDTKDLARALEFANKAIAADPKYKPAYVVRARIYEAKNSHAEALPDWTKVLELDPKDAAAHHARGEVNFKMARFAESLGDFDKHLELRPDRRISHWQRGITCYYAGKYEDGKKQFEAYQEYENADVENAVWRFMCMVKAGNGDIKKAQADMLKIGDDRRVPMRDIYELYSGNKTPADVLAVANKVEGAGKKNSALFYAHLYLGIWFDLTGDRPKALEHLNAATEKHRIEHYMWDVARVHRDLLAKTK